MDRRQKKTRLAVYDAFTELLETRSYSSVTVQEIIDKANIGRSTFYSHFETKDELLKSLCTDIFDHVFSEGLEKEKTHDFSSNHEFRAAITHILYHLQDSRSYIKGILTGESGEIFNRYFKEYLQKIFANELKKRSVDVPEEYLLNHLVAGFAETVRWWMQKPEYQPEEIADFFFQVMPI